MKFIHIADVHLGAVPDKGYPWSKKREEEIWRTFRSLVRRAEEEQVDLLLIAGDLFHRQPFPFCVIIFLFIHAHKLYSLYSI